MGWARLVWRQVEPGYWVEGLEGVRVPRCKTCGVGSGEVCGECHSCWMEAQRRERSASRERRREEIGRRAGEWCGLSVGAVREARPVCASCGRGEGPVGDGICVECWRKEKGLPARRQADRREDRGASGRARMLGGEWFGCPVMRALAVGQVTALEASSAVLCGGDVGVRWFKAWVLRQVTHQEIVAHVRGAWAED